MRHAKLKFTIVAVCGLTAWGYFALTAPSQNSRGIGSENIENEQKTVQNFANYLEKNPDLIKNTNGNNHNLQNTYAEIDAEAFQKISHQVMSANLSTDEEKAFKMISDGPSKEKILVLSRLVKNDEAYLGLSAEEKSAAINHLRKQFENDPALVRHFVEAAAQLNTDQELKPIQIIMVGEVAKHVKATNPEASLFLSLLQSLNLPDFDPLMRDVSSEFPEIREMALRKQQTREIASQPEAEAEPEPVQEH